MYLHALPREHKRKEIFMITNSSYKLLKKIRKPGFSENSLPPKCRSTYEIDIETLISKDFIRFDIIGYAESLYPVYSEYKITNEGIAYIQQKRKGLLVSWIPYTITTLIAIAALVNSIFARLGL